MSIVNRRNAVIGWGVLKLSKRAVRRRPTEGGRLKTPFLAATVAGLVGAVTFWRKHRETET